MSELPRLSVGWIARETLVANAFHDPGCRCMKSGGCIFVKDISSLRAKRYTRRKEYGLKQSSA
jgi:hypothetical protein